LKTPVDLGIMSSNLKVFASNHEGNLSESASALSAALSPSVVWLSWIGGGKNLEGYKLTFCAIMADKRHQPRLHPGTQVKEAETQTDSAPPSSLGGCTVCKISFEELVFQNTRLVSLRCGHGFC